MRLANPIVAFVLCTCAAALAQELRPVGAANGASSVTDAFPGFDTEGESFSLERKEPRWFSFITGPDCADAPSQMDYCRSLEADGSFSKAARQYDALVREWPTSAEAPAAQLRLAEIREVKDLDYEEAFSQYRYMLDFFSMQCDYNAISAKLYELAGKMREEGKTIIFFRFKNTVDVRRAFEAAVLRAPGAAWVPEAMLTIADLREEEGKDAEAVKVYENLRNIHHGSRESAVALFREATARMRLLREYSYNRDRCMDTLLFLESAAKSCDRAYAETINEYLLEARTMLEDEAYRAAKFYDGKMRTRRSAIKAYSRFLSEFPDGAHAGEARLRLEELKGDEK